jgi:hypothetical protein
MVPSFDTTQREEMLMRVVCEPGSDVLEPLHRFLTSFVRIRLRPVIAERAGLAGYELLANGLNYGRINSDVVFELSQHGDSIKLSVKNYTVLTRIRMLTTHLEKLRAGPEALYLEEMRRSVSGGTPRAMLGLARVMHEAKMTLDMKTELDTCVLMTASLKL